MKRRSTNNILLALTALIWGSAFVAQSVGMDYLGPFTFNSVRSFLGGAVLLPVIFFHAETERKERRGESRNRRQKDAGHRRHLLRDRPCGCKLPPADRPCVHQCGEGRVYHGSVHIDRACPGAFLRGEEQG